YSTAIPSGLPVASVSVHSMGGTCAGLATDVPCNDAPFIGFFNVSTPILSLVVTTTDTGFFVDQLFLQNTFVNPNQGTAPEPVMSTLIGSGLVGLVLAARRRAVRQS